MRKNDYLCSQNYNKHVSPMNILELQSLAQHSIDLYNNKLMLFSDIRKLRDTFSHENNIIDALVLTLVTEGQINLVTEDEELHLKRGDFFACLPNYMIRKSMASMDFENFGNSAFKRLLHRTGRYGRARLDIPQHDEAVRSNSSRRPADRIFQALL